MVNRHIVVAAFIIVGFSLVRVWTGKADKGVSATRVLLAGYIFVLILSLLDTIPGLETLAGALANLAVVSVVLASGIFQWIAGIFQTPTGAGSHQTSH